MAIRNFRVGALVTDTPSDIIVLFAKFSASPGQSVFRKMPIAEGSFLTVGQGYQVTSGKTLYVVRGFVGTSNTNSNSFDLSFGYLDNDFGVDQNSPTKTNPFILAGMTSTAGSSFTGGGSYDTVFHNGNARDMASGLFLGPVPAGKYLFARVNGLSTTGVGVTLWAIEV